MERDDDDNDGDSDGDDDGDMDHSDGRTKQFKILGAEGHVLQAPESFNCINPKGLIEQTQPKSDRQGFLGENCRNSRRTSSSSTSEDDR